MNGRRPTTSRSSIRPAGASTERYDARTATDKQVAKGPHEVDDVKVRVKESRRRVKAEFDLWTCTERHVTPAELGRYWKVSTDTIYRDIRRGALMAYRVGSSGALRIRIEEARRYGRPGT